MNIVCIWLQVARAKQIITNVLQGHGVFFGVLSASSRASREKLDVAFWSDLPASGFGYIFCMFVY